MKRITWFSFFLILTLFAACKKGDNYCPKPEGLLGFKSHQNVYLPTDSIYLELNYTFEFDLAAYELGVLYNFTVPTIFINAKGDRGVDVVEVPNYYFKLKDPANAPDSVVISAYGFTDCGRSEVVSTTIYYDN